MKHFIRILIGFIYLFPFINAEVTTFRCSSFDYASNQDSATVSYATCEIYACPGKNYRYIYVLYCYYYIYIVFDMFSFLYLFTIIESELLNVSIFI